MSVEATPPANPLMRCELPQPGQTVTKTMTQLARLPLASGGGPNAAMIDLS